MGRKKGAAEAAPLKMVTAPRVAWMEKQKAAGLLVGLVVLLYFCEGRNKSAPLIHQLQLLFHFAHAIHFDSLRPAGLHHDQTRRRSLQLSLYLLLLYREIETLPRHLAPRDERRVVGEVRTRIH